MQDISSALTRVLTGRTAFMGIGNTDRGDDGLGVRLAEALMDAGVENVMIAGTTPENHVIQLRDGHYDTVVLLDAVLFGAEPGSVTLMDAAEIKSACPQVSTHKLSLGTLAEIVRSGNGTSVWLLGVRPMSIEPRMELSEDARKTVRMLTGLITAAKSAAQKRPKREQP